MTFKIPSKLRGYVRGEVVDHDPSARLGYVEKDMYLGALVSAHGPLVTADFYNAVGLMSVGWMPFFLEQLTPFPVLTVPAEELSDCEAVAGMVRIAESLEARFVLGKARVLRGTFGSPDHPTVGLGGVGLLDLTSAVLELPGPDSWVSTDLLPPSLNHFNASFVGGQEYLSWRAIEHDQAKIS